MPSTKCPWWNTATRSPSSARSPRFGYAVTTRMSSQPGLALDQQREQLVGGRVVVVARRAVRRGARARAARPGGVRADPQRPRAARGAAPTGGGRGCRARSTRSARSGGCPGANAWATNSSKTIAGDAGAHQRELEHVAREHERRRRRRLVGVDQRAERVEQRDEHRARIVDVDLVDVLEPGEDAARARRSAGPTGTRTGRQARDVTAPPAASLHGTPPSPWSRTASGPSLGHGTGRRVAVAPPAVRAPSCVPVPGVSPRRTTEPITSTPHPLALVTRWSRRGPAPACRRRRRRRSPAGAVHAARARRGASIATTVDLEIDHRPGVVRRAPERSISVLLPRERARRATACLVRHRSCHPATS